MQNATNFKGLNNVLEGIEIGTLLAINNSLGFYHNHMLLRGNNLKIGNEPDAYLMNPIENFDETFGFLEHLRFYLMGAESALFGFDNVSFPFGEPMEGSCESNNRRINFGAAYPYRSLDFTYQVSTGYRDISAQLSYFGVPPGFETVVNQLEYYFTQKKEVDDLPRDDYKDRQRIIKFPTG